MRLIRYNYPTSRIAPAFGFSRSAFGGLDSEINRLFESAYTGFSGARNSGSSVPGGPVSRRGEHLRPAPNSRASSRESVEVEVVGGELTITVSRKGAEGQADATASSVSRTVTIPEGTPTDKVTAAYENGVLTVTLPKPEAAKPRKVAIQVS